MAAKSQGHVAGILATYDVSDSRTVADVGGGRAHLLQAVLGAYPAKGVLFGLPHVIEEAAGLASHQLTMQAGENGIWGPGLYARQAWSTAV